MFFYRSLEQIKGAKCLYKRDNLFFHTSTFFIMIWTHDYNNEKEVLEGVTQQLFKHIQSTRFVTKCIRTGTSEYRDNRIEIDEIYHPREQFFLALPGGIRGSKLLDFWQENHYKNTSWRKVCFYQTHEMVFSHNYRQPYHQWGKHPFFTKAGVPASQIHPIEQTGNAEKNASIYALNLPYSRGLYYNPAHAFEGDYATRMYESPFHCAIISLDRRGDICQCIDYNTAPLYGSTYYTSTIKKNLTSITISTETLLDTPRLLLIILERNFNIVIGESPLYEILKNHPNVHIFSDIKNFSAIIKEKGLNSLWFHEIRVAP